MTIVGELVMAGRLLETIARYGETAMVFSAVAVLLEPLTAVVENVCEFICRAGT